MIQKPPEFLVLGEGPVARVMALLLRAPVIDRNADDTGWEWSKRAPLDRTKLILATSHCDGVDQIIRLHAEARSCPKVSRIAVLILLPDSTTAKALLGRDVFGRGGVTSSTFRHFAEEIGIVAADTSLQIIISRLAGLKPLLVDTWRSQLKAANCIPPLVEAIRARDQKALLERMPSLKPRADAFVWDSVCFPTSEYRNPHHYANAVSEWLESVTLGVTPDWERGYKLLSPLATR